MMVVVPRLRTVATVPAIETTLDALLEKETGSLAEEVAVRWNVFPGMLGTLVTVAKLTTGVPLTMVKLVVFSGAGI